MAADHNQTQLKRADCSLMPHCVHRETNPEYRIGSTIQSSVYSIIKCIPSPKIFLLHFYPTTLTPQIFFLCMFICIMYDFFYIHFIYVIVVVDCTNAIIT